MRKKPEYKLKDLLVGCDFEGPPELFTPLTDEERLDKAKRFEELAASTPKTAITEEEKSIRKYLDDLNSEPIFWI